MIIDPSLLMKIMPHIAAAAEKIKGKKTGLPELLKILPEITEAFKDPNTDETPETPETPEVPDKDPGLSIGGRLSRKYNSLIPGLLPFGKGESPFDLNYDTQQLDRLGLYNNTDDSLFKWLGE